MGNESLSPTSKDNLLYTPKLPNLPDSLLQGGYEVKSLLGPEDLSRLYRSGLTDPLRLKSGLSLFDSLKVFWDKNGFSRLDLSPACQKTTILGVVINKKEAKSEGSIGQSEPMGSTDLPGILKQQELSRSKETTESSQTVYCILFRTFPANKLNEFKLFTREGDMYKLQSLADIPGVKEIPNKPLFIFPFWIQLVGEENKVNLSLIRYGNDLMRKMLTDMAQVNPDAWLVFNVVGQGISLKPELMQELLEYDSTINHQKGLSFWGKIAYKRFKDQLNEFRSKFGLAREESRVSEKYALKIGLTKVPDSAGSAGLGPVYVGPIKSIKL